MRQSATERAAAPSLPRAPGVGAGVGASVVVGAGVVGARRVCFSARLARAILPEKSSAKVKPEKGELVITLKKAEPGVEWSTLLHDVNE